MMSNARAVGRGFTLVELIAAVVVLSVAVPPMLWTLREAQLTRADAILAVEAQWLASDQIEAVLADRHSTTLGYDHVTTSNYPTEDPVTGAPMFARAVSVRETEADLVTPGTGFKVVEVTVSWTTTRGRTHDLVIATVVTEGA